MKNILSIIFITFFGLTISAQVKWFTIEEAVIEQKEHPDKKLFVDFYTDWCGYCKTMEKKTLNEEVISKLINTHFIPVKFNAEKQTVFTYRGEKFELLEGSNGKTLNMFAYRALMGNIGYPSFVVVDGKGKFIDGAQGYFTPKQFMPFLKRNL
ncbi:MAG: thioredoxin family protein [Flavobacteriales bacterium]